MVNPMSEAPLRMSNNDESKLLLNMKKLFQNEHNGAKYVSEKYVTKLLIPRKLINVQRSLFFKGKSLFIICLWQLFSEEDIGFI